MIIDWNSTNKYPIIYADPPWNFETWSDKGHGKSPQKHYKCMTMKDIEQLPIPDLSADDCLLFMWVTTPMLDQQLALLPKWGFKYKTIGFNWVKLNKKQPTPFIGLGHYTRANSEFCLIARKGKPPRPKDRSISQIVMTPIREHSRKPDIIREYIERMYDGPYLELFCREQFPNWDCIGNEIDKFSNVDIS